jgi:hypothetical protein
MEARIDHEIAGGIYRRRRWYPTLRQPALSMNILSTASFARGVETHSGVLVGEVGERVIHRSTFRPMTTHAGCRSSSVGDPSLVFGSGRGQAARGREIVMTGAYYSEVFSHVTGHPSS